MGSRQPITWEAILSQIGGHVQAREMHGMHAENARLENTRSLDHLRRATRRLSNQECLEIRRQFPLPGDGNFLSLPGDFLSLSGVGSVAVTRTCPRLRLLVIFPCKTLPGFALSQ